LLTAVHPATTTTTTAACVSGVITYDADVAAAEAGAPEEVLRRAAHLRATGAGAVKLPFGVTLLAPAWQDEFVWRIASTMHQLAGVGCGPAGHGAEATQGWAER
jgi:hypothetical protein